VQQPTASCRDNRLVQTPVPRVQCHPGCCSDDLLAGLPYRQSTIIAAWVDILVFAYALFSLKCSGLGFHRIHSIRVFGTAVHICRCTVVDGLVMDLIAVTIQTGKRSRLGFRRVCCIRLFGTVVGIIASIAGKRFVSGIARSGGYGIRGGSGAPFHRKGYVRGRRTSIYQS
jgi:hypothetical protein